MKELESNKIDGHLIMRPSDDTGFVLSGWGQLKTSIIAGQPSDSEVGEKRVHISSSNRMADCAYLRLSRGWQRAGHRAGCQEMLAEASVLAFLH